jgi:hypothetical protein
MDTSIRGIGQVTLADGSCRQVYAVDDGTQYVVDDDGQLVVGTWLLMAGEEPDGPCDRPVIIYSDGAPTF